MTTAEEEREYWAWLAGDPVNMGGGDGMPSDGHYTDILERSYAYTGGLALDLGCGVGRLLTRMARRYAGGFYGVDISAEMLDQVPARPNISLRQGDGRTIPKAVPTVDFAWSVLLFQHIPQTAQAGYLREVAERLTPGGRFVLQWVADGPQHDYSHPTEARIMLAWAEQAGLSFVSMWRDTEVAQWLWAVWEKP